MTQGKGKKVFVGLSGGVDSSVSAALLKQQGYDVHGVFIQTWSPEWLHCTWQDERRDAMRVAIHLDIPFHDLDLSEVYKRDVADFFIAEYAAGRTPNPDVLCNRYVKFGAMWQWAKSRGADYVATGHYAQSIDGQLHVSPDASKDQSYFLWTLQSDDLEHIIFPIGHMHKTEVRKLATDFNIPVATKADSQGICFLGHVDMAEFLGHYIDLVPGKVLDVSGNEIGTHNGALTFTLGQRHGFTLFKSSSEPYFVLEKNIENNSIVVGPESHLNTEKYSHTNISLGNIVWRDGDVVVGDMLNAAIRYHGALKNFLVTEIDAHGAPTKVIAQELDATITPGQSLVFYKNGLCQGGGVIQ